MVNLSPLGGVFGIEQRREGNSEPSENKSQTATGKDSPFGTQTNQYHLLHLDGYLSSQVPLPGALQVH